RVVLGVRALARAQNGSRCALLASIVATGAGGAARRRTPIAAARAPDAVVEERIARVAVSAGNTNAAKARRARPSTACEAVRNFITTIRKAIGRRSSGPRPKERLRPDRP